VIVEVAVGLAAAALAGGLVRVLRRPAPPPLPPPAPEPPRSAGPRGLKVRDVITGPGLEVALGGVLELDEDGFVLRAFRTLEHEERWLVQLDREGRRLALGAPSAEVPAGSVPEALPIGGRTVRLERRGVAQVRSEGEGLPAMQCARYAVLAERAGRTLVVIDPEGGARLALALDELDPRGLDVLRGGDV
jgi:hypothetical protein